MRSTVDRQHPHSTPQTSGAEAATDRREGVAGAERYQDPGQPAAGRALAASGSEQWARPKARSDVRFHFHTAHGSPICPLVSHHILVKTTDVSKHNLRTHWGCPSLRGHPPHRHQDHAGRDRPVRRAAAHVPLAGRDLRHQRRDEDRRESRGGGQGVDHPVRPCRDVHDQRHPLRLPPRPGAGGPAGHPEICGSLGDGRSHPGTRPLHHSLH